MVQLYLLIAIFPIYLIGLYIYNKDKEKEPISFLFKLLFAGLLSAITVIFFSTLIYLFGLEMDTTNMNTNDILIYCFLHVASVEEGSKLLYLYLFAYKSKYYDYTFDMIVYGVFVSLGFALFENIIYVFDYGMKVGLQRAGTAIIIHACCGVLMGLFLGKAKVKELNNDQVSYAYKIFSFLIPMCIHGMYDFCAFTGSLENLIIVLITVLTTCIVFVNYNSSIDKKLIDSIESN
ncbi:MAG: PrsW family intramembrane metalloprotease [Bacilli bacterium]